MFKVHNVILSEDIATTRFACDISRCKGACCVVGDAGAPVDESEMAVLEKAFEQLSHRLDPDAVTSAKEHGVVQKDLNGTYEINVLKMEPAFLLKQMNLDQQPALFKMHFIGVNLAGKNH